PVGASPVGASPVGASPVGDWENGIARIRCSDCGYDYFRPFSCKSFFLCPSCGQGQLR
ncbi:MAG: transposase zinc-binding domain-containing protein, partial [Spirochaetota bacterium]